MYTLVEIPGMVHAPWCEHGRSWGWCAVLVAQLSMAAVGLDVFLMLTAYRIHGSCMQHQDANSAGNHEAAVALRPNTLSAACPLFLHTCTVPA